jgi:peptidoglycan/xylan/chitin deacetylase (PgdA/CDA1 family)
MRTVLFCFTVDDVAYDGYSTEEHLGNVLEFCADQELKATWFVVPRCGGHELGDRPGYVRALRQAGHDGHEVAQHGLDHDRFECGIPPAMVLELPHEGPARAHLAAHRAEIEAALSVEALRARLRTGRRILERALGTPVVGFRAPCLSTCPNLFRAIAAEGYRYDSSKCLQPAAWDLINGRLDAAPHPISRETFVQMQEPGLAVLPLTAEYAWYLRAEAFPATLALSRYDFGACLEAGIPFVCLCHVSPVQEGAGNRGFDLFRELVSEARARTAAAGARFISTTLATACERYPVRG